MYIAVLLASGDKIRSMDIDLIKGLKTSQIVACPGSRHYDEIINFDNLLFKAY
jgi:glutamate 5-kinase